MSIAAPILVVGDVMLDRYLSGTVERISPEAPVPVLRVTQSFNRAGGAANVAANIAALRGQSILVGATGHDAAAELLREELTANGVADDCLLTLSGATTTTKTRVVAGQHQIVRFDEERVITDTAMHQRLLAKSLEQLEHAKLVVLSDYAKGVCSTDLCSSIIKAANRLNLPVLVDPKAPDFFRYAGAFCVTPNRSEAEAACKFSIRTHDDAIRAAQFFRAQYNIAWVVITLGADGMVAVGKSQPLVIPTNAAHVFDVTGAGDTAVAMLAVALAEDIPMADACFMANTAAGLQVAQIGAAPIARNTVTAALEQKTKATLTKILDSVALKIAVQQARLLGKTIGFTNGCFDILHHGHIALLDAAAKECDVLIVGVNSDASVRRLKGPTRPLTPAQERKTVLAALSNVAFVCEFDEDTPLNLINTIRPDVLIKGADYQISNIVGAENVLAYGGKIITPPLVPHSSTTGIVNRILATARDNQS
jgi:D-beta-D-heptose 7-phosphate kinase/D-beta-D-heptose 1-phosphate adenosyltransferase